MRLDSFTKKVNAKRTISVRSQIDGYRRIIINTDYKSKGHYIDFFVADYKDYNGKDIIELLDKNEPINLNPNTGNPYDQSAVAIYDKDWIQLGYVPSIISKLIYDKIEDNNHKVNAIIKNVKLNAHDECKIEIRVFINKIKKLG